MRRKDSVSLLDGTVAVRSKTSTLRRPGFSPDLLSKRGGRDFRSKARTKDLGRASSDIRAFRLGLSRYRVARESGTGTSSLLSSLKWMLSSYATWIESLS